ncbi:hypothetical protein AMECASPLE_036537 [Ameca splendens]|uniref:Uncharacterized protein n=1 Tax=Ameca splendens TaxID=208324 RepID=A0ABV0XWK6_9TELE
MLFFSRHREAKYSGVLKETLLEAVKALGRPSPSRTKTLNIQPKIDLRGLDHSIDTRYNGLDLILTRLKIAVWRRSLANMTELSYFHKRNLQKVQLLDARIW